ncbi:MAG TPA: site-specific tyrosine recombinase XerD [Ignavibacteria bacterium]|jgi:integrase/recombinase XerD
MKTKKKLEVHDDEKTKSIRKFLLHLELEKSLSDNTIQSYNFDLNKFKEFTAGLNINSFYDTDQKTIEKFIGFAKKNNKASSMARMLSSLRQFYNYLIKVDKEKRLKLNPLDFFDSPKMGRKLPDVLTVAEIDKILNQPDVNDTLGLRDKTILEVMYACGLRVSEIINLKIPNVLFNDEVVRVFGKGSKERVVPIGASALEWINIYFTKSRVNLSKPYSEDYLFLNWRGRKLSRMAIWDIISKYSKMARITKEVHPHIFRHSFATHLIDGGADLRAVQEMLGHSDISTTQIYTQLDMNYLKYVINEFHPRGEEYMRKEQLKKKQ